MKPKTILKILVGIAATILLGAIGSGLWERLLAPSLDWIFRISVDLISSVSLHYKNGIYEAAAKGFHEDYSLRVFLVGILLFSVILNIYALRKHERISGGWSLIYLKHKEFIQWSAVILSLAFMYLTIYSVGRHDAINRITTYSIQSMDILRPHIGEKQYFLLKSEFLQIKSSDHFTGFNSSLILQANANNVRLPVYEPL